MSSADKTLGPKSLAELGTNFYTRHFDCRYVALGDQTKATDLILFPDSFYSPFRLPIEGKTVAIVGNGKVTGHGKFIDSHDVVIRMSYPYQWKQDQFHDGEKLTLWAGLGRREVFYPSAFHNPHDSFEPVSFIDPISRAESLHCISHHHVGAEFWEDITKLGLKEKLHVHWAAPVVFNEIETTPYGLNGHLLGWITARNYHKNGYGGWYNWDTLLSGVRITLLAAMSKPASINIFGMNFYQDGDRQPWDMHNIPLNVDVFEKTLYIARENGITTGIFDNK